MYTERRKRETVGEDGEVSKEAQGRGPRREARGEGERESSERANTNEFVTTIVIIMIGRFEVCIFK